MLPRYDDIRALTDAEPMWFTEDGVPRYAPFTPSMLGIYDTIAALAVVRCHSCGANIHVGIGRPRYRFTTTPGGDAFVDEFSPQRLVAVWGPGDPPRHDCPGAGETMTADVVGFLQVWERRADEWARCSELEGVLDDLGGLP